MNPQEDGRMTVMMSLMTAARADDGTQHASGAPSGELTLHTAV